MQIVIEPENGTTIHGQGELVPRAGSVFSCAGRRFIATAAARVETINLPNELRVPGGNPPQRVFVPARELPPVPQPPPRECETVQNALDVIFSDPATGRTGAMR